MEGTFGGVQRAMCVCTSSRSNWKASVKSDNVFCISISLATESARACSTAARGVPQSWGHAAVRDL